MMQLGIETTSQSSSDATHSCYEPTPHCSTAKTKSEMDPSCLPSGSQTCQAGKARKIGGLLGKSTANG